MMTKTAEVVYLLPGHADDQGWNASAALAGERIRKQGFDIRCIEGVAADAIPAALKDHSARGARLIVGHGCEYGEPVLQIAADYPGTCYFVMDQPPAGTAVPANVGFLNQRQEEGAYLCGRLAAWLTQSGRIGFVGGMSVATQKSDGLWFRRGVASLKPELAVIEEYAGSFEDRPAGQRLARRLIEGGVDVIMQTADTSGLGVIDVCRERRVKAMGYILDQRALAPEIIATSLVVDIGAIVEVKVREVMAGAFLSGIWRVGLAEGMIGLGLLADFVPAKASADLEAVRQEIVSGRLAIG